MSIGVASAAGRSGRAPSVRDLPWKDVSYDLGKVTKYAFSHGRHDELDESQQCLVCLSMLEVSFGDGDGDGEEEALILISTNTFVVA